MVFNTGSVCTFSTNAVIVSFEVAYNCTSNVYRTDTKISRNGSRFIEFPNEDEPARRKSLKSTWNEACLYLDIVVKVLFFFLSNSI
jgi:hypothetical protein